MSPSGFSVSLHQERYEPTDPVSWVQCVRCCSSWLRHTSLCGTCIASGIWDFQYQNKWNNNKNNNMHILLFWRWSTGIIVRITVSKELFAYFWSRRWQLCKCSILICQQRSSRIDILTARQTWAFYFWLKLSDILTKRPRIRRNAMSKCSFF